MDVLKLLEDQHDEVKQLFKRLEQAEGSPGRQLFETLRAKLTLHEELEETYFYPALKGDEAAVQIGDQGRQGGGRRRRAVIATPITLVRR